MKKLFKTKKVREFNDKGEYTGKNPILQEVYKGDMKKEYRKAIISYAVVIAFMVLVLVGFMYYMNWMLGPEWR